MPTTRHIYLPVLGFEISQAPARRDHNLSLCQCSHKVCCVCTAYIQDSTELRCPLRGAAVSVVFVPPMYEMQYTQTPAARRSWSTVSAVSAAVDANLLAAVTAAQWVAASYAPMPSMRMVSAWEEGGEISHRS